MRAWIGEDDPRFRQWADCESPIEQLLCCGLFAMLGCRAVEGKYSSDRRAELAALIKRPAAFVFTQQRLRQYRADFLLVMIDPIARRSYTFIIECDGKEYHSPERDGVRDSKIIADSRPGFVWRITGSDIVTNLASVIDRIGGFLRDHGVATEPARDCPVYGSMLFPKSEFEYRADRAALRREIERQEARDAEEARVERYRLSLATGIWDDDTFPR
ncbi:MAG TPA: hypothetical protein VGJ20_39460 [Xanthobacteraceae bacterium]|jgi:very-short-patch-repair endonuclease